MIELPTKPLEPISGNPRFSVFFGKPKSGKTTIVASLPNSLIIDLEGGSKYIKCQSLQARTISDLAEIKKALIEANKTATNGFFYTYGIIDTATALEDIAMELALINYRKTSMGKSFGLNVKTNKYDDVDIRSLPNGGGYLYIREAFKTIIDSFKPLFQHLILLGHTKDKAINKQGKELTENSIDLSGKLERIVSADADALGYVYRNKRQTIVNFNGGEDFIAEARPLHLRGKEIVVAESDEEGNITTFMDRVFINENK